MKQEKKLFFIPLGGCSEIGMNMYLYGLRSHRKTEYILVDAGVTFPNPEYTPGVELIIPDTTFVEENQDLKISFLNIDTDLYEPCVTALEKLYPLVSPGGVVLLDNYNVFPGETKAVDEYFGPDLDIRTLDLCKTPSFIVKD